MIAQFGGQTPLNLADALEKNGVRILGTPPAVIDMAEDRDLFRDMMKKLDIPMPESGMASTVEEALQVSGKDRLSCHGASFLCPGRRGMEVVHTPESMEGYMRAAVGVTPDRPILIDRFLQHATEAEADAIADGTHAFVPAVMEHIELAGIHSGDSACIIPSMNISKENFGHHQRIYQKDRRGNACMRSDEHAVRHRKCKVYVIEANPRASRTVPLVSKVCNVQMVRLAPRSLQLSLQEKAHRYRLSKREIFHTTASRKRCSRSTCSRK